MRMMANSGAALLLVVLGGLLGVAGARQFAFGRGGITQVRPSGPTIEQIQELSDLVVLRVQVADVLTAEHSHGAEMALLVRGDCDLTIDLSAAQVANRDDTARTARIELPQPQPLRPRVDHDRTRVYNTRRTAWWTWHDPREELYAQAMEQAQQLVAEWAGREEQRILARRHAEAVITTFYRQLGWVVTVAWRTPATPNPDPAAVSDRAVEIARG